MAISFVSLGGPLAAFLITWLPVTSSIRVAEIGTPNASVVEELRRNPGSEVLRELHQIGVSAPNFDTWPNDEIVKAADQLFAGRYTLREPATTVALPFDGAEEEFGVSGWDLHLCSFIVPALLGRAYVVTQDTQYLNAAINYIVAWAEFESALLIPRGYVFNDHATAARAIVLTEVWRLYRGSPIYRDAVAIELFQYVLRLRQLLSKPVLFEFNTNHGLMQSLSLLHLSLAFPALENTSRYTSLAIERLLLQLPYYVNAEGVILEHSAGYHHNGLRRLAAAWRYLGLLNEPVPEELAFRYAKSLKINIQLLRPDRTLPPIGDTRTQSYRLYPVAIIADESRIATHIETVDLKGVEPEPSFVAPAAGLGIFWSGLDDWPTAEKLSQTVVHWGNFVTRSHKHADEMGISLWAAGKQWVRSIGAWPYDRSRLGAIGWRSSNAPHWLDELRLVERNTMIEASGAGDSIDFIEMVRRNSDGSEIRRQLILVDGSHWLVLDSYHTDTPRESEVLWRFSPGLSLDSAVGSAIYQVKFGDNELLGVQLISNQEWEVASDPYGKARWNNGLVLDDEVVPSPAIRATSLGTDIALATVFSFGASEMQSGGSLHWRSGNEWKLSLGRRENKDFNIRRRANKLIVTGPENMSRNLLIHSIDGEANSLVSAENAFLRMQEKYSGPIRFHLDRRAKVTFAVALAAMLQWLAFVFVRARIPGIWTATLTLSTACWIGLCCFLHLQYFA